jgi:hypothetical protein
MAHTPIANALGRIAATIFRLRLGQSQSAGVADGKALSDRPSSPRGERETQSSVRATEGWLNSNLKAPD